MNRPLPSPGAPADGAGARDPAAAGTVPSLQEVLPGRRLETPAGSCYHVRWEHPLCFRYGAAPLLEALAVSGRTLAVLGRDESLEEVTLARACFIDTETTGLAGGTGTYVFLVGVGWFEGDLFVVDQYFMEDYDREPALIAALEENLRRFEAVVSFNGKAFDLPLLETRFILARRPPPLRAQPHLDLLAAARRLWGLRLESCSLQTLERAVLGETRAGDIPGRLVPQHYFRYLRNRDPRVLKPVFEHNRRDVLSLLSLACRAARRFESFLEDPPGEDGVHPLDLYSLARLYRAHGLGEAAVRCYRACLDSLPSGPLADRAGLECVRLLRRLGRAPEAAALSRELADARPPRLWALVELAKDLEHRLKDYRGALEVVDRAVGLAEGLRLPETGVTLEALAHRRDRLQRRLRRAERRALRPDPALPESGPAFSP